MAKTRVHELAKKYNLESKLVLEKLQAMGEYVKSLTDWLEESAGTIHPDDVSRFASLGVTAPWRRYARRQGRCTISILRPSGS